MDLFQKCISHYLITNAHKLSQPRSALDSESEKLINMALNEATRGKTTIIVAHRLSTILTADRIVMLSNGKVVESGTHQELISKKGQYWDLIKTQI